MTMKFFTSDLHIGHEFMSKKRGFDSVDEHDNTIIDNWNSTIGDDDDVFILGDFIWNTVDPEHIIKRLKGQNISLLLGNHDRITRQNHDIYNKHLNWIKDVFMLKIKNGKNVPSTKIWLSHYRHAVWNGCHYGSWHLFGHEHGDCGHKEVINYPNSLDVGVDTNNFYPYSWDDVVEKVKTEGRFKEDYRVELKSRDENKDNFKWKANFIK